MPRYYFDLWNGSDDPDIEGYVLVDDVAARNAALELAGRTIVDNPGLAAGQNGMRVQVLDERRNSVFRVTVRCEAG